MKIYSTQIKRLTRLSGNFSKIVFCFFSFLYLGSYVCLDQKNHPEISTCLISHGYRHRVADGHRNGGMSVCQRHVSHGISGNPESPLHHCYLHGAKSCFNLGGGGGGFIPVIQLISHGYVKEHEYKSSR